MEWRETELLGVEYSGLSYYQLKKEQLMTEKWERDKKTAERQGGGKGTKGVSEFSESITSEEEVEQTQGMSVAGNSVRDAWKEYWEAYFDRMKNEMLENFYEMALENPQEEKLNEQMEHREDEGLFSEKPLEPSNHLKASSGLMELFSNDEEEGVSGTSEVLGIGSLRQNWLAKKAGLLEQVKDGRALIETLREHMDSMYVDGRLANDAPSFSIGAGSYTEEEWDDFMRHVDLMLSSAAKEDRKNGEEAGSSVKDGMPVQSIEETAVNTVVDDPFLLTNETSRCSYPSEGKGQEEIHYIVCYTQDGIICNRAGERQPMWQISFENEEDYDKVMDFLSRFDSEENLRFAAHKNFWQDFLAEELDEEEFTAFYAGGENGMPDYFLHMEDGVYVDKESLKYQKYFAHNSIANPESQQPDFVGKFYKKPSEIFSWLDNDQSWKREFVTLSEERRKGWR